MKNNKDEKYIVRFDAYSRFLHILVITSFLTLAITGMTIKFSGVSAFQTVSHILGGYKVTGFLHRFAAIITFLYFFLHIINLINKAKKSKKSLIQLIKSENSMLPKKSDFSDFYATIKWFLGIGPRPDYGRWTYWEKFDYFAVFWGVAVIGASGLLLWFPEFFTSIGIHGQLINIATIIHSDEALLATGFIFTIHFYNTHFRPDKFPIDTVIFTGKVKIEELKYDRPKEYSQLILQDDFEKKLTTAPLPWMEKAARIFGFAALITGMTTILMIIYSMIFLYN